MGQEEEGKDASRRRRAQHLILSDVGWIAKDAHNARRGKEGPRERTKRGCGGTRGLTRRTAKEREFIIIELHRRVGASNGGDNTSIGPV